MSRKPTHFPSTLADCHKLILQLHAELAQFDRQASHLRDRIAARQERSVAITKGSGTNGTSDPSVFFHAIFPSELARPNVS
jgi:hypothetical protein